MRVVNLLILIATSHFLFGQSNQKGNTVFHAYAGTDWYKALYRTEFRDTTTERIRKSEEDILMEKQFSVSSITSSGLWGARVEHFITDKFSIGLDIWYGRTKAVAECRKTEYNLTIRDTTVTSAIISKELSRLNTTLRFDLHFGNSTWIDPYANLALGASFYKYLTTSTDRDTHEELPLYIPVSFKLGAGTKFWINPRFAAFAEINIGGPLLSGGICYKVPVKIKLNLKQEEF